MNEGFGKDFYRKGNSVKRFGPFSEPPGSETEKLRSKSTSQKSALKKIPVGDTCLSAFWNISLGNVIGGPGWLRQEKTLNFLWPKMARLGPPF